MRQLRKSGARGKIGAARQVSTGVRARAQLTSQDFDIQPNSPEEQLISYKEPTKWTWDITPKEVGPNQKLHLTIIAVVTVKGETIPRQIKPFRRIVLVDVTWRYRLSAFWEKNQTVLVTAILGVLGTAAVAIWRRAWVWNKLRELSERFSRTTPPDE